MSSIRNRLGIAARNLLKAAFARERQEYSAGLTGAGISQVAKTFATDPDGSRQLLREVFLPERFDKYGHAEVPCVAGCIATLAQVDPDFAVLLYKEVFSRTVLSRKATPFGQGSIISMHSDEAQDYEIARVHLTQYYPVLLEDDFERGVRAAILAVEGYAVLQNTPQPEYPNEEDDESFLGEALESILSSVTSSPIDVIDDGIDDGIDEVESDVVLSPPILKEPETHWTSTVDGMTIRFTEDRSCGWAWDPNYVHHEGALAIFQRFVDWFGSCSDNQARAAVRVIFAENHVALVWSRLFMVAAKRPEVFGDLLWPTVTNERVLQSMDMGKDAIDAVGAFYPSRTDTERREFEERALEFDFSHFLIPERMRAAQLSKLFQAIGDDRLATDEARDYLASLTEAEVEPNNRPISITSGPSRMPEHWWLTEQDIDIERPEIEAILTHSKKVQAALGWQGVQPPSNAFDIEGALASLRELEAAMDASQAEGVPDEVLRVPADTLARGCTAVLNSLAVDVGVHKEQLKTVQEMTLRLCSSPYPIGGEAVEAQFENSLVLGLPAARAAAADNLVLICSMRKEPDETLAAAVESLRTDTHPAVRTIIAKNIALVSGWGLSEMWNLAEKVVSNETNSAVLRGLVNGSLARSWDLDPVQTERLLLRLQERLDTTLSGRKNQEGLRGDTAALLAVLYVWGDRKDAGERVRVWCRDPKNREVELHSILFVIRNALVHGYGGDSPKNRSIRERSQELVAMVVDSTARELLAFPALTNGERKTRQAEERALAKSLNQASSQLYFVSGAFKEMHSQKNIGLKNTAEKAAFLTEVGPILRRLGDIGTPAVIYQLLQMLEFLFPACPEDCFDLVSHALLDGGRRNGYEFESMNAEIFVKFVGMCLADYPSAFRDAKRRQDLIDALDSFIEAGWSSARRLIFELPHLIQ